jgi:4-aminobutyrate aminotransferase-like enzyme
MRETRPWERAESIGIAVSEALRKWMAEPEAVRVVGATVGMDLPSADAARAFSEVAYSENVLLYTGGPDNRTAKLVIPLVASDDEIAFLLRALHRSLERVLRMTFSDTP